MWNLLSVLQRYLMNGLLQYPRPAGIRDVNAQWVYTRSRFVSWRIDRNHERTLPPCCCRHYALQVSRCFRPINLVTPVARRQHCVDLDRYCLGFPARLWWIAAVEIVDRVHGATALCNLRIHRLDGLRLSNSIAGHCAQTFDPVENARSAYPVIARDAGLIRIASSH